MSLALIAWLKEVTTGITAIQTFDNHYEAATRAANGKKPYAQSEKVEAELAKLNSEAKKFSQLASSGIGKPAEELDWKGLAKMIAALEGNDDQRLEAARQFLAIQKPRLEFVEEGQQLSTLLRSCSQEAAKRSDAARKMRDAFGKLSEKFPDPTGLMTAELFKCYQAFEAASGALGSVADAAKDAFQRVEKDLIPVRQKNKELDQAFTAASEASDKRRKAK